MFHRMLDCLHHCLATRTLDYESIAFPVATDGPKHAAA
jgi:hypothetical protein